MQPFERIVHYAVRGLLAISLTLLVAGAAGLLSLRAHGTRLLSVQTASMAPIFRPGDALIVGPVEAQSLHVGDIVSYQSPRWPTVITHRLIAIDQRTGWLTTAGDALHSPDQAFPPSQILGRATAIAPRLGSLLNFLRTPVGLGLTIYLPATIVISNEIRRLSRIYARPFYSVKL